eukprot:2107073-Pyramimonas_sp.AAC.2
MSSTTCMAIASPTSLAYLGLTINWGAMLGYSAIQGACDWSVVLPLYAGCVSWTMVYDTIYAHQTQEAWVYSHDRPIGHRNRGYILMTDQSDTWVLTRWQRFILMTRRRGVLKHIAVALSRPRNVAPRYIGTSDWCCPQDKKDDQRVGIRSTALFFGDKTPLWLSGFAATSVGGLALAGHAAGLGWPYYAAVAAFGGHMAWQ